MKFFSVRREHERAVIAAEVAALGIDEDRLVLFFGKFDDLFQNQIRQNAFRVVGENNHVATVYRAVDSRQRLRFRFGQKSGGNFAIRAEKVAVAHKARFDLVGREPSVIIKISTCGSDAICRQLYHALSVADDAHISTWPQARRSLHDVSRAAEDDGFALHTQDGDRRFRRNAFDLPIDETVDTHVADHRMR